MNESPQPVGEQPEPTESSLVPPSSSVKASRPLPENKRDFHRELDRRLGLLRREIGSLKERAKNVSRRTRTEYLELLDALDLRTSGLERQVDRFVGGCNDGWESFRAGAEKTWRDLKQNLEGVALSFRQRHPGSKTDPDEDRPRR